MDHSIAAIIPCYRAQAHIVGVVSSIPGWISHIFVVDDACPDRSGRFLQQTFQDPRLHVIFHEFNQGVGGATITGYRAALAAGCEIVVKIDGDGQMDPAYLPRLLHPILSGRADFTKGNRFYDLTALRQMPFPRRLGNFALTLLTKAASGFWHISDPTNGYTAMHNAALRLLNLDQLSKRFFFETSALINLNIIQATAIDVPIPARYGDEKSSLKIWRALFGFPPRLAHGLLHRLLWRYFIYDINAVTILLTVGSLMTGAGVAFGGYHWVQGARHNELQSMGTIAFAMLPILLGFQMLLQGMLLDVVDRPVSPLSRLLRDDISGMAADSPS